MRKLRTLHFVFFTFLICLFSCEKEQGTIDLPTNNLFTNVPLSHSNVTFNNTLTFTEEYNPYTFKNFLNGGGVALGDINNDGLVDIYFTGNLVENKLYLNKGNFQFEDITDKSGLSCSENWSTGAAFVDINHDGLLDVYVCKSGKPEGQFRYNQLFVNNGDLTFTDQAKNYGLDFTGLSIHSAFFDYDKDGDLDCYLLNNSIRSVGAYDIVEGLRDRPDPKGGNKLLKNMEVETGEIRFEDVSTSAGIYTSAIGFGLGVSVADLNGDHWDDLFVSNDFFERDYLYLNQKDGTFKEVITSSISELSTGSMGADIADINNDMRPDIFVTEMLPEQLDRYKSKAVFESYDKSQLNRSKGYHNQFGRNVLQYNTGNDGENPQFLELGRYHGVEATDWSWGALMADFDNNGLKDIFVANGIAKDLLDQDHITFYNPQKIGSMVKEGRKDVITTIIESFPKEKLSNYLFLQDSLNHFEKTNFNEIDLPSFSNGSAYGDLDNDGDLDLVLNVIDEPARIYKNNTRNKKFLQVKLQGAGKNTHAIGAKVIVHADADQYFLDVHPMRGYESSVEYKLHFGLNQHQKVDSLHILWPDDKSSTYYNLAVDSCYHFNIKEATEEGTYFQTAPAKKEVASTLLQKREGLLSYRHKENRFSDFDVNRMLLHMISNEGPKAQISDLDGDNNPEILITGSVNEPCAYFEFDGRKFQQKNTAPFEELKQSETCNFILEDFNKDNKTDIFLLNGGSEFNNASTALRDRLLTQNKNGTFSISPSAPNTGFISSACGTAIDIDQDGTSEIIIGSRMQPSAFGVPADGLVLENRDGKYKKNTALSKALKGLGMVKAVATGNLNSDPNPEVLFSREYGSLVAFSFQEGQGLVEQKNNGLSDVKGLWNDIELVDIDLDGDLDIVACNFGLNQRFKNLSEGSLYLFVNDFDGNGKVDNIYCVKENGQYYPIHLKNELLSQIPALKKKALRFSDYAKASMADLFGEVILSKSIVHEVNEYRSGTFINNGESFTFVALPREVQYSEQKAVWAGDLNADGFPDLVMGGNQYEAKPEVGINAASYGHILINDQKGNFINMPHEESGFFERGQIRDIVEVVLKEKRYLIILKNSAEASVYEIR